MFTPTRTPHNPTIPTCNYNYSQLQGLPTFSMRCRMPETLSARRRPATTSSNLSGRDTCGGGGKWEQRCNCGPTAEIFPCRCYPLSTTRDLDEGATDPGVQTPAQGQHSLGRWQYPRLCRQPQSILPWQTQVGAAPLHGLLPH